MTFWAQPRHIPLKDGVVDLRSSARICVEVSPGDAKCPHPFRGIVPENDYGAFSVGLRKVRLFLLGWGVLF